MSATPASATPVTAESIFAVVKPSEAKPAPEAAAAPSNAETAAQAEGGKIDAELDVANLDTTAPASPAQTPAIEKPVAATSAAPTSEASNIIPIPAPAKTSRAGLIVPIAAAIVFSAGLAGVGGLALRGSNTEAMNRFAAMESTLSSITSELAAIKAQTASLATPPKVSVSLAPVLTRLDALGEATERAQREHQSRLAALASGERGNDKAMSEKLGALNTRLERMEKSLTTASLPATPPVAAGNQPLPPKPAEANLTRLPGYVLHEVENGVAVIEDRRGVVHEIMRGENLPGVGRLQKLERRGSTWVAVTEKGIISAR